MIVRVIHLQPRGNDIGRPFCTQALLNVLNQRCMATPPIVTWLSSAVQRLLVCAFMPVNPGWNNRAVAFDLAADSGVVAAQPTGDFSQAELEQLQVVDDVTFF